MIVINLLRRPLDNERRVRLRCKREFAAMMCVFLVMAIVCGFVRTDLDRSLVQLQTEKSQKMVELVEAKNKYAQFEMMNQQIVDLRNSGQEVLALAIQQRQPLQLLDAVSHSLDPLNIWLAKLDMENAKVTLMGFAQTRGQIVQFAQNLKRQELFQSVAVLETGKKTGEFSLYPFTMNLLLMSELNNVTPS